MQAGKKSNLIPMRLPTGHVLNNNFNSPPPKKAWVIQDNPTSRYNLWIIPNDEIKNTTD